MGALLVSDRFFFFTWGIKGSSSVQPFVPIRPVDVEIRESRFQNLLSDEWPCREEFKCWGYAQACARSLGYVQMTRSRWTNTNTLSLHWNLRSVFINRFTDQHSISPNGFIVDSADEVCHPWLHPHCDPHWLSMWSHLWRLVSSPPYQLFSSAVSLHGNWLRLCNGVKVIQWTINDCQNRLKQY